MFVKRMGNHTLEIPKKATKGSAAFDLRANLDKNGLILKPNERALVDTGFAWQIPSGFVGMVCPRSGLAAKNGITVLNAPGIIDPDYRGSVKVLLVNLGQESAAIAHDDRIAQMVMTPALGGCCVTEIPELNETTRGIQGFGSTGNA